MKNATTIVSWFVSICLVTPMLAIGAPITLDIPLQSGTHRGGLFNLGASARMYADGNAQNGASNFSLSIPAYSPASSKNFLSAVNLTASMDFAVNVFGYCPDAGIFPGSPCLSNTGVIKQFVYNSVPAGAGFSIATTPITLKSGPNLLTGHVSSTTRVVPPTAKSGEAMLGSGDPQTISVTLGGTNQLEISPISFSPSVPMSAIPLEGGFGFYGSGGGYVYSLSGSVEYETGTIQVEWSKALSNYSLPPDYLDNPESLRGLLTAKDQAGKNIPVQQAATAMGFDHFNWVQYVVESPLLTKCSSEPRGSVLYEKFCLSFSDMNNRIKDPLTETVLDPPFGGYYYQTTAAYGGVARPFPVADNQPFYADEWFADPDLPGQPDYKRYFSDLFRPNVPDNAIPLAKASSDALGYVFYDRPRGMPTGKFAVGLAGVKGDCRINPVTEPSKRCEYELLNDFLFEWGFDHGQVVLPHLVPPSVFPGLISRDLSGTGPGVPIELKQLSPLEFLALTHQSISDLEQTGGGFVLPLAVEPTRVSEPGTLLLLIAAIFANCGLRRGQCRELRRWCSM